MAAVVSPIERFPSDMTAAMEEEEDDIIEEENWFPPNFNRGKRKSVCGESFDPQKLSEATMVTHPKTPQQTALLLGVLAKLFLFRTVPPEDRAVVANAMFRRETAPSEVIIKQDDDGDYFFVVESGVFDVFVHGQQVHTYNQCGFFGELALMHNCPRAATVSCREAGVLWALDRSTFRAVIMKHAMQKRALYEEFIERTPMLHALDAEERQRLIDALEPVFFCDADLIIKQGDSPDAFYFVVSGSVRVTRDAPGDSQVELAVLQKGAYFGELALITHRPRAANVVAYGSTTCARLSTTAFERLLGPCISVMKSRIPDYEQQLQELLGPNRSGHLNS